jgi:hypothetical protein
LRASAPQLRAKSRRFAAVALCTRLRAQWRGNLPDIPVFSLEIVTFYHSTGGLPRRPLMRAPRNDVVVYTAKQQFILSTKNVYKIIYDFLCNCGIMSKIRNYCLTTGVFPEGV